jgi:hypothetical protein
MKLGTSSSARVKEMWILISILPYVCPSNCLVYALSLHLFKYLNVLKLQCWRV